MSMNLSEFKKHLGSDPRVREPETRLARGDGPEYDEAVREAEAFERKLESAVLFDVDSDTLTAEILQRTSSRRRSMPRWWAMAAGLLLVVGASAFVVTNVRQPDTIEEYVAVHFGHDGRTMLARADDTVSPEKVRDILASWDLEASAELTSRVTYIKKCFTMDGLGAHMVVSTDQGNITLIVMPRTRVNDGQRIAFEEMEAHLVSLGPMSAALIGTPDQDVASFDALVRNGIHAST